MRWLYKLPLRLRSLFNRGRVEEELSDELRFHLERLIEEQAAKGMTLEEARYAALRELGGMEQIKEECRDMRRVNWLENILQDVRYGLRQLRRGPAFTGVAVLMLALGIGANTAIFSLIDAVMLKMLPVKNPQQLVLLNWRQTKPVQGGPGYSGDGTHTLSYLGFKRLRRQNDIFSSVMGFVPLGVGPESVTVNIDGQPSGAGGEMVSGNYFAGLGVSPFLGRVLTDADEDHAARVTVLGYGYWTRKFGRDPAVIGKTIVLGGEPFSIVGVAPPEFFGLEPGRVPDFWIPLIDLPSIGPWGIESHSAFTARQWWWLMVVGRLKPNVSQSQARAALKVWIRQTLTDEVGVAPADAPAFSAGLDPASRGLDYLRREFSEPLLILMGVVGLVLLIACANIAALLLARAEGRRREIAMRLALGASRARLIRQLLTESLLLAAAGGMCGMVLAGWGAKVLLHLVSGGPSLPVEVHASLTVLGFAAAVSLLTGILFGLAPSLGATRLSLSPALKENSRGALAGRGGARWRLGKSLVIAQVAFSLLLVTGAGLFIRTLMNLEHQDLGFDPHGMLLFRVNAMQSGYQGPRELKLYDEILRRVLALPGVEGASLSLHALLSGWCQTSTITAEGGQSKPGQNPIAWSNLVGPNFFKTMRIRLLLGRDIGEQDTATSPPVVVVNESLARKLFGNLNPLGRRFTFGQSFNPKEAVEIVGVVQGAKYTNMRDEPPLTAYAPVSQEGGLGRTYFEVRTAGDPPLLIPSVRRAVAEVDRSLALSDVKTQDQQIDEALVQEKLIARLASFFGTLALALAAIGLYGTLAYTVGRRTNEIGVRVALGASRKQILKMVLREAFALVLIGMLLGLPLALAAGRLVASQLYGLKTSDPLTLSTAIGLLVAVASLAAYLPARRASKVDPMVALRYE
jgi:predicted permease